MSEETLLSFEQPLERAEIAAQLRSLADGLDGDGPLTVAAGDQTVTVTPPDSLKFELEVEREYDEDDEDNEDGECFGEISIEAEIEWDETDVDAAVDTDTEAIEGESEDEDTAIAAPIEPDGKVVPAAAASEGETIESLGQFQLYVDRAGKWRWRLVHRNANIIAVSGQGYASRQKAEQGMASVMRNAPDARAIAVE